MEEPENHRAAWTLWTFPRIQSLEDAVFYTLSYADVFNYPLTLVELHRYLVGWRISLADLAIAIRQIPGIVVQDGYYTFRHREAVIPLRRRREQIAAQMWPRALSYGAQIAQLPYVRMVALTGALAVHNVDHGDDYDYLIVTAHGRVWVTRRLIVQLVVKPAARRGDEICPNYILSEAAMALPERDLFHAHELAQMIPLYGLPIYESLRQANAWTEDFLPNAGGLPIPAPQMPQLERHRRLWPELLLSTPVGTWLERREMSRLQRKLDPHGDCDEVQFSPDCCKGHIGAHGHSTFEAFAARLQEARQTDLPMIG